MTVRRIVNKYEGECVYCGRLVEVGEEVVWEKGIGIAHAFHFSSEQMTQEGILRVVSRFDRKRGKRDEKDTYY